MCALLEDIKTIYRLFSIKSKQKFGVLIHSYVLKKKYFKTKPHINTKILKNDQIFEIQSMTSLGPIDGHRKCIFQKSVRWSMSRYKHHISSKEKYV